MKKYLLILMALFLVMTGMAYADYYTWEDENGVIQITDYPPPKTRKSQNVKVHKAFDPSAVGSKGQADKTVKPPDIVLYTKNDCVDCDKAREFLQSANLVFTEYNMDTDEKAVEMRKTVDNGEEVPFAVIDNQRVYGFSETVYGRLLKMAP
ncbi:MAG: glutaredoxin family protein [Deltaproteobacteria bacterium]|nr:glutaredoxin family protein [Deltaproteobacteria bacterium]